MKGISYAETWLDFGGLISHDSDHVTVAGKLSKRGRARIQHRTAS
jgi:hypothetical protein